jgi:hypothetical protein
MLVPFSDLPDHSRVWIYQSSRKFSDEEVSVIQEQMDLFLAQWTASVRFIQQLQTQFDVDLLDKMNVTFYSGDFIAHKSLLDFRKMAKNRSVSRDTIVFNNLVTTKEDYLEHWEVPAHESWHNRFLS